MSRYLFSLIIFELVHLHILLESDTIIRKIGHKFLDEGFVPLLFSHLPNSSAQISYNKIRLGGGTLLTRDEVIDQPKIKYCGRAENHHTVVMARPVIPEDGDPSKYEEFDHWIVGNVPGSKIHKGDIILPYNIPPKNNDELYPYVIAVFEQPGKLNFVNEIYNDTLKTVPGCVRLKQFISKYDLIGPTIANYFFLCY
ncbi:phosphatidylethanolamine-binding protein homolog F40A3.3-like [Planococcus citri]|uniref:phosphatidylethanolamine-binding protein homolog F40A3.3-like n=1 Tax=Planococcus citri TaxID=170843 RepID=UPI0031F80C93